MRSTTIRFADSVYERLESASEATGLPINSIVVVACLDWLRDNPGAGSVWPGATGAGRRQMRRLLRSEQTVTVEPAPHAWRRGLVLTGGDPLHIFTASAQDALTQAQEEAERTQRWIGTEHLLHGLHAVEEGRAAQVLRLLGVDVAALRAGLEGEEREEPSERPARLLPTAQLREVLKLAKQEMSREGGTQVGTDHLLLGLLLERDSRVTEALEATGVSYRAAREALAGLPPEV